MHKIIDILIPRFVTEDVALYDGGDGVCRPYFSMRDFDPGWDVEPDMVARMRHFNLFGLAIAARPIGDPVSFREWKRGH